MAEKERFCTSLRNRFSDLDKKANNLYKEYDTLKDNPDKQKRIDEKFRIMGELDKINVEMKHLKIEFIKKNCNKE